MKIATVTLNPALDQTVTVNHFLPNTVNYAQKMQFTAGGKGINVAAFLADAGFTPSVTGFLGQDNAEVFAQFFASKHIDDHFIRIPGRTRIGVKIVDEANQQTTDINMPGLPPPLEALDHLTRMVEQLATFCDWFVLSGTLPPGVPATTYAGLIQQLQIYGKQIVLDTSREALSAGIQAGPTIIKPNLDELQQLTGQDLTNEQEIEPVVRPFLEHGIQLIVVSLGERGAIFIDSTTTLMAVPPKVTVKSTVGAGDAMIAGLLVGQMRQLSLPDCARLATAFALGKITRSATFLPPFEELQAYSKQVAIHA